MAGGVQPGFAVWLTGLPASGKTAVAQALSRLLKELGIGVTLLDSDDLRFRLTPNPTFSAEERDWFYGVIAFLAELLTASGANVLVAATASRRAYRSEARQRIARFAEVFVDCPPAVCRARDPKGLWARADRGVITSLPGVGEPYEPPETPEVRVDTAHTSAEESARQILTKLNEQGFLAAGHPSGAAGLEPKADHEGGGVVFKRILLATDGSSHAREALEYARELAVRDQAQVVVVSAFEPVPAYLGDPWGEQVIARHVAAGEEIADDAARELRKAEVDTVVEVLEGPPADAILKVAEVRDCDLIVMGGRGRSSLAGLLLGSVSHRVLAHARIPVMVVRAAETNTEKGR